MSSTPSSSASSKTSGLAIASLVCGIAGLCTAGLGGIVGLILGIIALRKIKASCGTMDGRGLAIAGIIVGCASVVIYVVFLGLPLLLVLFRQEIKDQTIDMWEKARNAHDTDYFGNPAERNRVPWPMLRLPVTSA